VVSTRGSLIVLMGGDVNDGPHPRIGYKRQRREGNKQVCETPCVAREDWLGSQKMAPARKQRSSLQPLPQAGARCAEYNAGSEHTLTGSSEERTRVAGNERDPPCCGDKEFAGNPRTK